VTSTTTAASSAQAEIDRIDQLIDANRRAAFLRLHFAPSFSADEWQAVWNRCPDLWARNRSLSLQRGVAQEARDKALHKEWQAQQRRERAAHRKQQREMLRAVSIGYMPPDLGECDHPGPMMSPERCRQCGAPL
jgi:hypothetical protein